MRFKIQQLKDCCSLHNAREFALESSVPNGTDASRSLASHGRGHPKASLVPCKNLIQRVLL